MNDSFPVLGEEKTRGCPQSVPWAFIAPHERQANLNHDQTLKRLAERGGLCASEMVAVVEGRKWQRMTSVAAAARLNELLAAWASSP